MTEVLDYEAAVATLTRGGVVAVPTDTVYGVAASIGHQSAIDRLFALKRRPTNQALPVLVDSVADVEGLGVAWSGAARRLAEACWPGALTIVVEVPVALAVVVGSHDASVGFRVPDDELVRRLLRACGPLAVSSANEHGEEPCHSVADVRAAFSDSTLDGVLDGGERDQPASTVVSLRGSTWRVLREGPITSTRLASLLDKRATN